MKKNNLYPSVAAQKAAERHEKKTHHPTTILYNDDCTNADGMVCIGCDWIRHNVEPRKRLICG